MPIPFKEIHEAAVPHIEALCRRWLPAGKRSGAWWVAQATWRADRNPSLGVSLTSGKFRDFATGDRGDLIDLYVRLFSVTAQEAARAVARCVGHSYADDRPC